MKPHYVATVSGAALAAALFAILDAAPAHAQDTPPPVRRIFVPRQPVSATPTPTPTATPTPAPRRILLPRGGVTPAPAASPAAIQPTPIRIGGPRPAPVTGAPPVATGRPAPITGVRPAPVLGGRPAPVAGGRPAPVVIQPTNPVAAQAGSQVTLPTGPIRFNVDAVASPAELARIDPTNFVPMKAPASAVTLKQPSYAALMQSMPIIRQFSVSRNAAIPPVMLDQAKVNLAPVLTRKGALPLVAQALQARPNLGTVRVQDVQVSEIKQGLVVRSFLNYQLKPGACTGSSRGQVEAIGIHCARRIGLSDAEMAAAFADPHDVHYVPDPRERGIVLLRAKRDSKLQQAEAMKEVANLRASLSGAGGGGRAALTAQLGGPEIQRLSAMSDEDLAAELINTGETKVEQVMFVPRLELVTPIDKGMLGKLIVALPPAPPPPPPPPKQVTLNTPLVPATFLTGFTLGKSYEWSYTVEKSIKWCVLGCKKTYYAHAYAHLSYGFGLRFPLRVGGNYRYDGEMQANGAMQNGKALYTADFAPFDGNEQDYLSTGLPADKLFKGKELVAEASAGAGFDAHIPIYPDPPKLDIEVGKDFTELLPAPFAGGNITPPAKGQNETGNFIFDQFDMLGGRLNFGIVGAQLFPAIQIGLHSDNVSFELRDNNSNKTTVLDRPGQQVAIDVDANQASSFTISKPLYNLGFIITPGIDARLFVDIGVWGHTWDFPLFFPEMTIEIPKGGTNFHCHDGTVCDRKWDFVTIKGETKTGPGAAILADAENWGPHFDDTWLGQCVDDTCKFAIKLVRLGTVYRLNEFAGIADADPSQVALSQANAAKAKSDAKKEAQILVNEATARLTAKAEDAWSILAQAVWTKQCKDIDCPAEITTLAKQMVPRAAQVLKADPDQSSLAVSGKVNKEFGPKFQAAIDRSAARNGVDSIGVLAQAVWTKQCLDDLCKVKVKLLVGAMSAEARANQKANPDMSSLELTKSVTPKYGKLFQAEIDKSKQRAENAKVTGKPTTFTPGKANPSPGGIKPIKKL